MGKSCPSFMSFRIPSTLVLAHIRTAGWSTCDAVSLFRDIWLAGEKMCLFPDL